MKLWNKQIFAIMVMLILVSAQIPRNTFAENDSCKTGHEYGEWMQITAPLCNTEGRDRRICKNCNDIEYRATRSHGVSNLIQVSTPLSSDFFSGKSIVCIGDSITYGVGAKKGVSDYVTVLGKKLGATITRQGYSGSVLSTGGHKPCNFFQLDNIPPYPDVVTIYMGVNDWDHARNGEGEYYYDLGSLGSTDTTTIYGAVKMWCDRIEELKKQPEYADTKFVFITPTITSWNLSINNEKNNWDQTKTNIHGFTLRHVCNAIMETCAQYRIPVLDLNLYSGIYYRTETDNNAIGLYTDGIHPNAKGHSMIAEAISEFLLDNYTLETRVVTDNGHSYIKTAEKQPTCIVDGTSEGKSCTTCGEVSIVPHKIPAKGHNEILTPDVKPGVSSPGYVGGTHCIVCGEILTHPEIVQPTGINIKATLNQSGVLTISGALSDELLADETTFIAAYSSDKRMLNLKNITEFDHSHFSVSIENMKEACTVKIFRWEMGTLRPLKNVFEITVEGK